MWLLPPLLTKQNLLWICWSTWFCRALKLKSGFWP
jgi:hypothetical protein